MERRDNGNDYNDNSEEASGGLRGFLRAYMRRFVKNLSLGSLPMDTASAKQLGKSVKNINQIFDVQKAVDEVREERRAKLSYIATARAAAPLLVKNTLLGSIQFGAYDSIIGKIKTNLDLQEEYTMIPLAFIGGVASGGLHGAGHLLWDFTAGRLKGERKPLHSVSKQGTILLHSMSHCVLFGTYAMLRYFLHPKPSSTVVELDRDEDDKRRRQIEMAHRIVSVSVSGFLAGLAEETVAFKYQYLESSLSARSYWQDKSKSLPLRACLLAGIPSAIGFLALEFSS